MWKKIESSKNKIDYAELHTPPSLPIRTKQFTIKGERERAKWNEVKEGETVNLFE
jgi:hypothetical protein